MNNLAILSASNYNLPSLLTFFFIMIGVFIGCIIWQGANKPIAPTSPSLLAVIPHVLHKILKPIFTLILIYAGYIALVMLDRLNLFLLTPNFYQLAILLLKITEGLTYFWLVLSAFKVVNEHLLEWLISSHKQATFLIISTLSRSLYTAVVMLMVIFYIPLLGMTGLQEELLEKIAKLLLISTIGWIFIQIVNGIEKYILQRHDIANDNGIKARTINTQVLLLKKIIQAVIIIVTVAACMMTFDSIRNLGAGLLTTAGVLGAIGAFASQQSLSRLFTGLQLAFTQPIRIGDTVIIENEFGTIEEITLSYVVVKLWDLRRLVLPTDYFFSKGLQNLTRHTTELLGTIFIYADYTLPVDITREKFIEFVGNSTFWNKNIVAFQVTDIKERTMELRGLVSASNAGDLWNLRCEVREKIIKFIVNQYPDALPVQRNVAIS